jgi:hypothetical protein
MLRSQQTVTNGIAASSAVSLFLKSVAKDAVPALYALAVI